MYRHLYSGAMQTKSFARLQKSARGSHSACKFNSVVAAVVVANVVVVLVVVLACRVEFTVVVEVVWTHVPQSNGQLARVLSPKIVPGVLQNLSKAAHSGGSSKPLQDGVVVVNVLDVPVVVVLVNVVEVVVMHVPQRTGHLARDAAPKITLLQTVALVLQSAGSEMPLHTSVVVVVAEVVVVVELAVVVVELTVVEVVLESVVDVIVQVVDDTDVVVVVDVLDVVMHELHNAGQC